MVAKLTPITPNFITKGNKNISLQIDERQVEIKLFFDSSNIFNAMIIGVSI